MSGRGKKLLIIVVLCLWGALVVTLMVQAQHSIRLENNATANEDSIYTSPGGFNVPITGNWQVAYDDGLHLTLCELEQNGVIEVVTEFGGYDYLSVESLASLLQERLSSVYDTAEFGSIHQGGSSHYQSAYFAALVTDGNETLAAQYTIMWISEGIRCYATCLFPDDADDGFLRQGLTMINSIQYPEPQALYEKYM